MKIIGKSGRSEFIVVADEDELAKIAGHSYANQMKPQLDVGHEFKVSELYQALESSRARKADIERLANDLRKVAGRVDSINQALASPIVEVTVKS